MLPDWLWCSAVLDFCSWSSDHAKLEYREGYQLIWADKIFGPKLIVPFWIVKRCTRLRITAKLLKLPFSNWLMHVIVTETSRPFTVLIKEISKTWTFKKYLRVGRCILYWFYLAERFYGSERINYQIGDEICDHACLLASWQPLASVIFIRAPSDAWTVRGYHPLPVNYRYS